VDRLPPPPSAAPLSEDEARQLRAETRDSMFLLATVRRPQGTDIAVKVRNLSPGGLMAECPSGFVRGDLIHCDLRGLGTVPGKVAWTAAGRIGVKFDAPVDHRLARVGTPSAPPPTMLIRASKTMYRPAVR